MDHVPTGDMSSDAVGERRRRMREQARTLRPGTSTGSHAAGRAIGRPLLPPLLPSVEPPPTRNFETPEWLDRSFVLPLMQPQVTALPHQPVPNSSVPRQSMPHHDDVEGSVPDGEGTERSFVRPRVNEVDFVEVIRRSDLTRTASRAAIVATGLAGVLLILFLLTTDAVILGMAIAFALVAAVAGAVRLRVTRSPLPHL